MARIYVSSSLLGGYDEPKILSYAILLICVEFHASIGLYRLATKWGAGAMLSRGAIHAIERVLLWFFLGLGVVVLLVLAGVIPPPLAFLLGGAGS